ncbi:MAG TPA: hypothetical protein VGQ07_02750 [Nitrospirales bacterium]|nr:hypothetical protein [Nitrospirales bacterium]
MHALVGRHKAAQQFRVESAVRVRHEGPRHTEHAWIVLQVTGGQFGQLSVEARRQIIADLAKLFIDDVEVIDQPLGCGGNLMLFLNRPGNGPVGLQQHAPVLQDTRSEQPALPRFGENDLRSGKTFSVLLEALDAEELGADGLFQVRANAGGWWERTHRVFRTAVNLNPEMMDDARALAPLQRYHQASLAVGARLADRETVILGQYPGGVHTDLKEEPRWSKAPLIAQRSGFAHATEALPRARSPGKKNRRPVIS